MKNIVMYSFTLGDSKEECKATKDIIHCWLTSSKKEAKKAMKLSMKANNYKFGSIIKVTVQKVK